jgi:hypothetical protein
MQNRWPFYSIFDSCLFRASKNLPPLENLAQDVDIESLEASINMLSQKYNKKMATSQKPLSPKRLLILSY